MPEVIELTNEQKAAASELLKQSVSPDREIALAAQKALAAALQEPIRQGVLTGNIISNIFAEEMLPAGARAEYQLDFYRPDNANDFKAYAVPTHGAVPMRLAEGDYVEVPTFGIGGSIEILTRYAREARWNVIARMIEVLQAGFVKKMNDDGWHTLLYAGFNRNIRVNDSNATAGQFTKKLISLMKIAMRRNAGGNSTSLNRGSLTHLFVSPEAVEDMRNWGIDEVDELTRREIFVSEDGSFNRVFGVNIVDLDELGDGQEYQDYYEQNPALGAANNGMASSDVEIVVGLDLAKNDSFVMPVKQDVAIYEDDTVRRQRLVSFWGEADLGFAVLNHTRIMLGSF